MWQMLTAFLLRPKPESRYRRLWNLGHWWLGRCILVAGIGNFFFGLWLVDSTPWWYIGTVIIIVFWCIIGILKVG